MALDKGYVSTLDKRASKSKASAGLLPCTGLFQQVGVLQEEDRGWELKPLYNTEINNVEIYMYYFDSHKFSLSRFENVGVAQRKEPIRELGGGRVERRGRRGGARKLLLATPNESNKLG